MDQPSSPATDLTVRPIRFTASTPDWRTLLDALGGRPLSDHPGWLVYQLGGGRLALHQPGDDRPAGSTDLGLETTEPLQTAVSTAASAGAPVTGEDTPHGYAGVVRSGDGTVFTLDPATEVPSGSVGTGGLGEAPTDARLSVQAIWTTPDTAAAIALLEQLGARPRLASDDGVWTDLVAPGGGLLAVHRGERPEVVLGFEWDGRLEEAQALLEQVGIATTLLDESYGRTLLVPDPDGGDELWITEEQQDLYGYTRLDG